MPIIKRLMEEKEISMVDIRQFAKYIDKYHTINTKPQSTLDIIKCMITKNMLVYIESKRIVILKDKLRCIKCHEFLQIYDKVNSLEIEDCKKCNIKYEYFAEGIEYTRPISRLYEINNLFNAKGFILKLQNLERLL